MSYESVHHANERFQMFVLFVLLGAFLLAVALMFVHPSASLLVFFAGLLFAGGAAIIERLFRSAERHAARKGNANRAA